MHRLSQRAANVSLLLHRVSRDLSEAGDATVAEISAGALHFATIHAAARVEALVMQGSSRTQAVEVVLQDFRRELAGVLDGSHLRIAATH